MDPPSVGVMGALLLGAGFGAHHGPGIGGRLGVEVPVTDAGAEPATHIHGGVGLVYHADASSDDAPSTEGSGDEARLDGWLVMLQVEAGVGVRIPLVVVEPTVGGGMLRASATVCDDASGCGQEDEVYPLVTPGLALYTSPTAPWAPVFLGVDGRYAWAVRGPDFSSFTLMGMLGVAL
jgi:hypothetical protein